MFAGGVKVIAIFRDKQKKSENILKKIDRIIKYLENKGVSLSLFERETKLGYSYLGKTKNRGAEISDKALAKIRDNTPNDYYKIFPEEKKEGADETIVNQQSENIIEPCEKFIEENKHLKEIVNKLESTINDKNIIIESKNEIIESKNEIITLQKELLGVNRNPNQASI